MAIHAMYGCGANKGRVDARSGSAYNIYSSIQSFSENESPEHMAAGACGLITYTCTCTVHDV